MFLTCCFCLLSPPSIDCLSEVTTLDVSIILFFFYNYLCYLFHFYSFLNVRWYIQRPLLYSSVFSQERLSRVWRIQGLVLMLLWVLLPLDIIVIFMILCKSTATSLGFQLGFLHIVYLENSYKRSMSIGNVQVQTWACLYECLWMCALVVH